MRKILSPRKDFVNALAASKAKTFVNITEKKAYTNEFHIAGKKAACLLSGGNIDVTILSRVITRGLLKAGRSADLTIALQDKPGQLKDVSRIIADLGGNVTSIHHDRANEGMDINGCFLHIVMETRDWKHVEDIRKALSDAGFKIVS